MQQTHSKTPVVLALAAVIMIGCTSRQVSVDESVVSPTTTPVPPVQERTAAEAKAVQPGPVHRLERSAVAPASVEDAAAGYAGVVSGMNAQIASPDIRIAVEPIDRETYAHYDDNPVKRAVESPVSTFSIDVDTGAYSNARRMIQGGRLPVRDAVRVEEFINYFSYDYPAPENKRTPFRVTTELGPNPWNPDTHLLEVGIKGYDVARENLPPSNLVFLIDVSGSMQSQDKLPLLKSALSLLARRLRHDDRLAIAVYAGASGVVLEPTAGDQTATILQALEGLSAGGSTNGASGIQLAYRLAEQGFVKDGINRVILATDGDFNVGTVDFESLKDLIEQKRKSGVSLTTLGFGTGNYNDRLMEQLADAGDGNYAYIDTLNEAQKVLVDQIGSTLQTIARDVKIQVEFNPSVVSEYRLIGYENRALRREDFNNDRIDAGEIGAGHTVTALYEVALVGEGGERIESLRYGRTQKSGSAHGDELAMLRLRYKAPGDDASRLIEHPIERKAMLMRLEQTSQRYRFAAAVAAFGQLLRGGDYLGNFGYPEVLALARQARGDDPFGYRGEFISLVNLAQSLDGESVRAGR